MISGPYRSGTDDPKIWAGNLVNMNEAAHQLLHKGHIPIIGVNMALPIIEAAGQDQYDAIMMPISMSLATRCDAVLRIGGISANADKEVEQFQKKGLPIYFSVDEIPYKDETGGPG
jgi:CMP-2-keto-3-deoxyoctulosonic acid synthetase